MTLTGQDSKSGPLELPQASPGGLPSVTPLAETTVLRHSADVAWRDVEGDMVVLDLNSGAFITFNGLGRQVWLAAVAGKPVAAIVDQVVAEYQVERGQALADVREFLSGLLGQGALLPATA